MHNVAGGVDMAKPATQGPWIGNGRVKHFNVCNTAQKAGSTFADTGQTAVDSSPRVTGSRSPPGVIVNVSEDSQLTRAFDALTITSSV